MPPVYSFAGGMYPAPTLVNEDSALGGLVSPGFVCRWKRILTSVKHLPA